MQIPQLGMIVFDECHHTNANHPYAGNRAGSVGMHVIDNPTQTFVLHVLVHVALSRTVYMTNSGAI